MMNRFSENKILVSALAADIALEQRENLVAALAKQSEALTIAQLFGSPKLVRELRLCRKPDADKSWPTVEQDNKSRILYQGQHIGKIQILYKSPLPGELQARLAIESAIDRFLEYLQKVHHIVVLDESDRHVKVFIPITKEQVNFEGLWEKFIKEVAFSVYGNQMYELPGLFQTFVAGINSIKLAKKETGGFGILRIPVVTADQAFILAAWYYSILRNRLEKSKLTEQQLEKLKQFEQENPEKTKKFTSFYKNFSDIGKGQINPTTANINQIFSEIQNLLNCVDYDSIPLPLLTENPSHLEVRSPGDDTGKFCYSCGTAINKKEKKWETLRLSFEASTQRLQSSSSERQPRICFTCLSLSFICPIKFSHRSVILSLSSKTSDSIEQIKLKEYIRLLANKALNLNAGKYLMLPSETLQKGKDRFYVSDKLGKKQYALAKVASIFPVEVLSGFKFSLVIQGSPVPLESRHLIFIKGMMDCYKQTIVMSGKEINMTLGDAVRYVQQDLPFLADYTLTKNSNFSSDLKLEQIREFYWRTLQQDLHHQGDSMDSDNQLPKRARLYRDVAALTGLTYAFAQFLESTAKGLMKQEDAEREVSKLIEKVDDAIAFCYYATLGDEKKTSVQARLYHNPDCDFIYSQTKALLADIGVADRESKDDKGKLYLQFYADDISRAYQHFATKDYAQEKDWKELTYNLKLSLYTRFPELVRKR